MKNLEIKVKVDSVVDIEKLLGFSKFVQSLLQVDTYYLVGETRLKIREEKSGSELIWYSRKMKDNTRESVYYRIPIFRPILRSTKTFLRLIFGEKVVVSKKRDLYIYKNTRIHLDSVERLGVFIELETVLGNESALEEYLQQHEEVKQRLHLMKYSSISGSYSDLLLK